MAILTPQIVEYIDYRQWLKELFRLNKSSEDSRAFSHRFLMQKLGLSSSGYMIQVMKGRKSLSDKLARRLGGLLKLSKRDTEYLLTLIAYDKADSQERKAQLFDRITRMRRYSYKRVDPGHYAYFEKWYHLAIRELIAVKPFKGDWSQLARSLRPPISAAEAEEAIKLLLDIGMVYVDHEGYYQRKDSLIGTGDIWSSETIANLQVQFANLGREALGSFDKKDRDISNLTLSVTPATFQKMRQRVAELRRELLDMAAQDRNPDLVLQCNFQIFPLADTTLGEEDS